MEIKAFNIDLSSLLAIGETRAFSIEGDVGATFNLEVRNEDSYYYNFITGLFQVAKSGLSKKIPTTGAFKGSVIIPLVTDDDQYDISITAVGDTRHSEYNEVRFGDGSLDINSSTGSNSLLMTKVIYQYTTLTLTIQPTSVAGGTVGTNGDDTIAVSTGEGLDDTEAFSITWTVANDKALQIIKQPQSSDAIAFESADISATPIYIPGEDIYPTATAAFTGDDVNGAVTSGAVVRMDNTDLSAVIKVGDKITTPVTTDTVDGDFSGGATAITMDADVDTKMEVGDQVTGTAALDAGIFTVASIDSTKVFSLSASAAIEDETTLSFSSKINRSLTTVTVVETSGTATDFTMSQDIRFRDNAPLVFYNQKNYRWGVDRSANVYKEGFIVASGVGAVAGSTLARYSDTTIVFPGTEQEKTYINLEIEAVDTLSLKPTIVNGEVTVQAGAIVFNQQQPISIGGLGFKIGGYGQNEILSVFGYDVVFSELAIALTEVSTTTTAAVINSTSVPVTSVNGILDDVSTVSGIGINAALADPTVDTGAGAVTGAGTLVLTAPQTLESGTTLTFPNAGLVATLTGNIRVLKAGTASQTIRFNVDNLVTVT